MRYLVTVLVFTFLWSCGSDPEPKVTEREIEIVEEEIEEVIPVDIEEKGHLVDISIVPDLDEKLKPLLKNYFLSQTYIDADLSELTDIFISLSENCDKFSYNYQVDTKNLDVEEMGSEGDVLTQIKKIKVDVLIKELTNESIILVLDGSIEYELEQFSYYGGELEWVEMGDGFYEEVVFNLLQNSTISKSMVSMVESGRVRKFSRTELKEYSIDELGYLRNEFYARKGYNFKTEKMVTYFSQKEWYAGDTDEYPELTELELHNIFFIKSMEEEIRLSESNDGSKRISEVYVRGTKMVLKNDDFKGLNVHQLSYLRNEFFARKGYEFRSKRLNEYFSVQDWYKPTTKDDVTNQLSEIEQLNIKTIRALEEK